jgi:hypothetical protein
VFDWSVGAQRDVRRSADGAMHFGSDVFNGVVDAQPEGEIGRIERRLAVAVVAGNQQQPIVIENVAKFHDSHHQPAGRSPCELILQPASSKKRIRNTVLAPRFSLAIESHTDSERRWFSAPGHAAAAPKSPDFQAARMGRDLRVIGKLVSPLVLRMVA